MAKFEEADPRWIVEEREDGRNINNWHWTEKDCKPWAEKRLSELFRNYEITMASGTEAKIETIELVKMTGDAFINVRKNKLIALYDLNVIIKWEGRIRGEENIKKTGTIEIPNLGDECDTMEDIEIRITVDDDDKYSRLMKEIIHKKSREIIWKQLLIFIKEIKGGNLEIKEEDNVKGNDGLNKVKEVTKKETQKNIHSSNNLKTIKIKEQFYASPRDIYECFIDSNKFKTFSQSATEIDAKEGGKFSWFSGSIQGYFKVLLEHSIIEMKWRFDNWHPNHYSTVLLNLLSPKNGLTILEITQSDVPETDKYGNENVLEITETGWRNQILQRIKAIYGYGI